MSSGAVVVLILVFTFAGCASPPAPPAASEPGEQPARVTLPTGQIMTVDELRPGMTGYGLTVFEGTKPERFGVEIISVLRNYDPQADMILIRCSGHNLEKTGIAAGMSGSPIYIDDKLIGALAYGWRFSVEPIAGVQPIERMLANSGLRADLPPPRQEVLPEAQARGGPAAPAGRSTRPFAALAQRQSAFARLAGKARAAGPVPGKPAAGSADRRAGGALAPLAVPLVVSGGSQAAMDYLTDRLKGTGFVPVRSGGAGGQDPRTGQARMEPGATLTIPLLAGDMDAAVLGTVTTVIGDRVLAFGHPMWGEGPVNLPMATGVVHAFIPSIAESFKMGSAGKVIGAVRRDESASICGVIGQEPYMTPMTVRVKHWTGVEKTYHYRVVDEWYFSARMTGGALIASIADGSIEPLELTVSYRGVVRFKGFEPYRFSGTARSQIGRAHV